MATITRGTVRDVIERDALSRINHRGVLRVNGGCELRNRTVTAGAQRFGRVADGAKNWFRIRNDI